MKFNEYQQIICKNAKYPSKGNNIVYPVLGLTGECGEVAEKVKKIIRDKKGKINRTSRSSIKKELGDVLWYLTMCGHEFKLNLNDIAKSNLEKLADRRKRKVIHGSGDNR